MDPTCKFPTWIQFASWMDISGKAIYNVQNGGRELYAKRLKDNGVPGRTTHRFSCLKRMDGNQSEVYITVRSIHKWWVEPCLTNIQNKILGLYLYTSAQLLVQIIRITVASPMG